MSQPYRRGAGAGTVFVIMMIVTAICLFGGYAAGQHSQEKVDRITGVCK